ncbi:MAG: hypothetical protein ISF22_07860 [Methanomassiliicoccus sp.]|nr:hypothetical protein [Methanomassiliicoccus sp.]
MNFDFIGKRWFLLFITIVLPLLLVVLLLLLSANICWIMVLLVWLGLGLMMFYLPKAQK